MLAIDTNVLVRYLTGDDPLLSKKAKALIDGNPVFVPTTMLLEAEWVLRSVYGFGAGDVARTLSAFAGLPTVTLEDAALASKALTWSAQGLDFADALHLARAQDCDAFMSFDRRLATKADRLAGIEVRRP